MKYGVLSIAFSVVGFWLHGWLWWLSFAGWLISFILFIKWQKLRRAAR